jgi:hypothetical protein
MNKSEAVKGEIVKSNDSLFIDTEAGLLVS